MADATPHASGSAWPADGGKRVVRVARLPTRVFADGSTARGVAVEGLYGLARLTVHEAELSMDSRRDPHAGGVPWLCMAQPARRGWRAGARYGIPLQGTFCAPAPSPVYC